MKGLLKKADCKNIQHKKLLSGAEIKKISYGVLKEVATFCDNNEICYFLVCGTALGAVRHEGFIPWDDDIDIGMPRADYEKFLNLYQSEKTVLREARSDAKYPYPFAKVCDKETCLMEQIAHPSDLGVYIDIFPLDGMPDNEEACRHHLKMLEWDHRLLTWKRISPRKKVGIGHKLIQLVAKTVLLPVPVSYLVKRIEKRVQKYPYATSQYVGHLVTKAIWGTDIKPKEIFEHPVKQKFEDSEFWVPGEVDRYLTLEYGDYMKLPPKEKQIAKHDFVSFYR